jgi:hypothetical protein
VYSAGCTGVSNQLYCSVTMPLFYNEMQVLWLIVTFAIGSSLSALLPQTNLCARGTIGHVHSTATLASAKVMATVCCPASCERCGGVDCWTQRGGLACCAAHVHELKAPPCHLPSDVGCVLPAPTLPVLPSSNREPMCMDVWSAAFPGERDDWKGRSCSYKVHWGQCDKFYASCQCSCGYCLPTRHSCDPHAPAPPGSAPVGNGLLELPSSADNEGGRPVTKDAANAAQHQPSSAMKPKPQPRPRPRPSPPAPPLVAPISFATSPKRVERVDPPPSPESRQDMSTSQRGDRNPPPLPPSLAPLASTEAQAIPATPLPSRSPSSADVSHGGSGGGLLSSVRWLLTTLGSLGDGGKGEAPSGDKALALATLALLIVFAYICSRMLPRRSDYDAVTSRSPSSAKLLSSNSGRAAASSALLDEDEEDENFSAQPVSTMTDTASSMKNPVTTRVAAPQHVAQQKGLAPVGAPMELDADDIYGSQVAIECGPEPQYDYPADLENDEEIAPDDSISVAWFKTAGYARQDARDLPADAIQLPPTPVTVEGPDGSRHAMDVELEGLKSCKELRRGMLQGYQDLLGIQLPAHKLQVHARLESGSSVLLTDNTPLSQSIIRAVSFYVWADALAAQTGAGAIEP